MKRLIALAATTALVGIVSSPALAQGEGEDSESYNTVIIYGDDECPATQGDTITVCARMDESERYRIPPNLRQSRDPENTSWTNRVRSFEAVGAFGPLSCTNIGGGSELGCTAQMIEEAYQERAENPNVRFSQLIADERQERLSTIDAEAAATQRRVEVLERAYMDKLEAERDAPLPGEEDLPELVDPDEIPDAPPAN
ncbi:hypothetical protein [Alteraurantiacibacter aestuarii]|uniref:DUF4124 domain-containing protein n=1 Tax=Alteraurantiacibacter aestuarii TaxID=650004 RepID=A0A844ZM51_9SPHN|nr:hypothetical protein [Alteraurantiacibacter aestuarii]MXO88644.1 hypothetical protein [Alteraurantiacibacter aestuarii]